MAVRAGTAFVGIEGDFSDLNKQVAGHFTKLSKQAGDAGKKAGATLGKGMATGVGAAGVAAGALFMKGLNDAISAEKANAKLAAQLGSTKATSKKMGKVAGKVYADAYGDSLEQVNDAIKGIVQNDIAKKTGKEVEGLTKKTLDLASAFDQDVGDATRGVGQLMRTGLVKDANTAFDVITKGFQKGGDKAGDLIDTLNEYSTQWRKLGINAQTATGLIVQGLKAGARDSDLVADALKEFSIRALDGSDATRAGFKKLGLDADAMAKKIGSGGKGAAAGLDDVLDRLRKIEDPVKRSQAAVELFGTQAEDLGDALFALDPSKAVDALGKTEGAAKKLGDTLGNNTATQFESLKRKTFAGFQGVAAKYVLPEFNKILTTLNDPKLTSDEKWAKIGGQISAAIERSDLEGKLKKVGEKAADLLWEGFKEAPIWLKVGGGVWLASKLGLTAKALAPMLALLSGKGVGGKSGGFAAVASKAAPIPVFVTNMGGMPGGEGTPPIVGGAPKGALGKVGKIAKGLGTKVALPLLALDLAVNLLDSKGNPISAVQNTASGITFGLIPEWKGDTEKAADGVASMKLKLDADVQAQLPPDFDAKMTRLQEEMNRRTLAIRSRTQAAQTQMAGAAPGNQGAIVAQLTRDNAADVAKLAELGRTYGNTIATAYTAAVDTHSQFFGAGQLTKGFTAELQKLPENARQSAYDTMINWANTLVQQGRLPKEAFNTLVGNIDAKLNLLPEGVKRGAKGAIDNLTAQFKRRDALAAADTMFNDLEKKYGEMPRLAKTSGDNMASNFLRSISFLRDGAMKGTGEFQKQSSADLKKARDDALKYGGDMKNGLAADLREMGVKGSKGAKKVRDDVVAAFVSMASGTGTASASTASTLYTALSNMGVNAEEILSALGIKVPEISLTAPKAAAAVPGLGNAVPVKKARGGHINLGAPSGDSVHALLERDEYVLNRKAVKKVGKAALDRLNFGEAPRFQQGGIVELLHPFNDPAGHGGSNSHLHVAMSTVAGIIALGKRLQNQGWLVGEHPAFGGVGGMHAKAGYHYTSQAIDVNWPDAGQEAAKIKALLPLLGGDLGAVTAEKVAGIKITGPDGVLVNAAQGIVDKARSGYNKYIGDQVASMAHEGAELSLAGTATGNGADLMKKISKAKGWNFSDWWALDAKETGHGANLSNPTSTARLRGQFLDMNYGKYGPGSDPAQNPSMGQQIQSMAQYIAERYGNPTKAWAFHQAHNYYRSGGLVSMLKAGGAAAKDKSAKVKNKTIDNILHSKKHKPKDHLSNAMIASLGKAGASELQAQMDKLKGDADMYADWADRASVLVNTEALQTALNTEMTARGGRSGMSDTKLQSLFPPEQQDAFIDAWLRNPINGALFNDRIQSDWLSEELNQLLSWRNALIDNPPAFEGLIAAAVAAYKKLKKEIKRIEEDIATITRKRDKAVKEQEEQHTALVEAKSELAKEQKKSKPDKARVKRLTEHVAKYRAGEADAHAERVSYNALLSELRGSQRTTKAAASEVGGDDGTGGRVGDLNEAITTMKSSLNDVHGLGSTMQRYTNPSQYQLGELGGTILGVQNSILGLTSRAPRADATKAAVEPPEGEKRIKDLEDESNRDWARRFAVSQAQYDVFKDVPFGGVFHQGGIVPGPIGAPRMILAQGGEVVLDNKGNYGPNVSVNFANGMEWLQRFVDIRVDGQTRTQSRRSERQLPGRPGLLR